VVAIAVAFVIRVERARIACVVDVVVVFIVTDRHRAFDRVDHIACIGIAGRNNGLEVPNLFARGQ
jgi:hypothetical protein